MGLGLANVNDNLDGFHMPRLDGGELSQSTSVGCPTSDPAVPTGATLGFDQVDAMAILGLPSPVEQAARAPMRQLATCLARDGASSGAARRLAARDVALARLRLRLLEGLQAATLSRWDEDEATTRQALALQRMIESEHRRLVGSMELLRRTERSAPSVSIKVNRAAVLVNR